MLTLNDGVGVVPSSWFLGLEFMQEGHYGVWHAANLPLLSNLGS